MLRRIFTKRGMPLQLIFFVTNRCNCSCRHCNLKDDINKEVSLLSIDEIEKIAPSLKGLASLSLTGGEPFLRQDIDRIASLFYKFAGVKNLAIITNGVLTDSIMSAVDKIASACPGLNLFIGVSVDEVGQKHDSIRVHPGAFKKAIETVKALKSVKTRYPRLSVGTATVCSKYNQDNLLEIFEVIAKEAEPDAMGINLERASTWREHIDGLDMRQFRAFTANRDKAIRSGSLKGHPGRLMNRILIAKEKIQYDLIEKIYSERRYATPCYAGYLLAVMKETGDVFACEMLRQSMGNIREYNYDFRELWFSKTAHDVRAHIAEAKCFCTYECVMTPNILFNPKYYMRLLKGVFIGK